MHSLKIDKRLLFIFSIYMNPIGFRFSPTLCYVSLYLIAFLYIYVNVDTLCKYFFCFNRKSLVMLLLCSFIVVNSIAVPIFHGTNEFSYIVIVFALVRKIFIYIFLLMLIIKKYGSYETTRLFMLYYCLATCCYVIGSIILFALPPFKEIWLSMITPLKEGILDSYGYTMRFGWSGFSGYRNTADCTLSLIFATYLYSIYGKDKIKFNNYMIIMLLCFIGNLFYGRVGVLVSAICLLIDFVANRNIRGVKLIKSGAIFVIVFGFVALLANRITVIHEWVHWAISPFVNLFTTGKFNNASADTVLYKMIFFPGTKTLLFGDGIYVDKQSGLYYMSTDSGVMRILLFGGIGLAIVAYLTTYLSIKYSQKGAKIYKMMLLLFALIFEIKGDIYYEILSVMLAIALVENNMGKVKREYFVPN